MLPLLSSLLRTGLHFGGGDAATGAPSHHGALSRAAARAAGTTPEVADEIAWHTDSVDAYLYDPFWWGAGGLPRLRAALAGGPLLKNLHFDDLFSPGQVLTAWRRCTSGTVAGLLWAWQHDDVPAARGVVGAGLHAVQDFYSHSTWVDAPERRTRTFLETAAEDRRALPLWTGSYELPDSLGIRPHGKTMPSRGVLQSAGEVLDVFCHPASPLSGSALCREYRANRDSAPALPDVVLGVRLPAGVHHLGPPGIALDSAWQADIAVQVRGLTDITGGELLTAATDLARATSVQWLELLGARLGAVGAGRFWDRVVSAAPLLGERERQYEDPAQVPYGFAAVGTYPPPVDEVPGEWYLRVRLLTARDGGAGGNVVAHAGGRSDVLSSVPRDHPLAPGRDVGTGADQAHHLGPYPSLPSSLVLQNGRSGDPDWALARAEVFAFTRDTTVTAGQVASIDVDAVLSGGQELALPLTSTDLVEVDVGI